MKNLLRKPLFVFELANNHMGRVELGLRILRELHEVSRGFDFQFAAKLQYRDLETFIHPAHAARREVKYVKRFLETRLSNEDFLTLRQEMDRLGFLPICTAFDERSVDRIEEHRYSVIKIGSCSLTDWPLLERIARSDKPLIVSTGGASLSDIDRVVSFFEHREKGLALMHCVGKYPTPNSDLQLNQIQVLARRYRTIPIGYSTHERPDNTSAVQIAIAKGAILFEKHVGIRTDEFGLNDYSATPEQVNRWLAAAAEAFSECGVETGRPESSPEERETLRSLQRGVFARRTLAEGEALGSENVFLAIPIRAGQLTANDLSKYARFFVREEIPEGEPVLFDAVRIVDTRQAVHRIEKKVKQILRKSKVVVPGKLELEISHHYGLERFEDFGAAMVTLVNRGYCKKLIVVLPGQTHPEQFHKVKEETFHVLWGDVAVCLDGVERTARAGEIVLIERGVRHTFRSEGGAVIEELSSTHHVDDSFYTDEAITRNRERKTLVTHWLD